MDLLVVGSGLYGLTVAERASAAGLKVTVIDRRSHIGGNAHSEFDKATGIEVHSYGSHLFHTSNKVVWEYVNKFTKFNDYSHRVFTKSRGQVFPMPINLATINQFFQLALSPTEARELLRAQASEYFPSKALNLEEKAVSLVGRPLYEALIKGYTAKQWQVDPTLLPAEVISRLPVRFNYDNRYFDDTWEGLPKGGYGMWFNRMADQSNIEILLNTDFFDRSQPLNKWDTAQRIPVIYTGAIDKYFTYCFGALTWRTLDFELETLNMFDYQGTSVMNYAEAETPYTRIHEFKHLHKERKDVYLQDQTIIMREFSRFANEGDEPYYPVNQIDDRQKLLEYRKLAKMERGVHFGGRLGTYQYLDMHMAIASALNFWQTKSGSL
jgi:UDP-galactopyranose mutase